MDHIVLPSATDVAAKAAEMIADEIEASDGLLLGLAGGSTPKATYGKLADMAINWTGVTTWMTDERWVPPEDPESNQSMVRDSLGTSGNIRFLAPNTRLMLPEAAAARMARSLGCLSNGPHKRIVTLLGMGDDGHTASLFPDTRALSVDDMSYVANWVPVHDTWRLTASYRALAMSNIVMFVVTGEGKADAVSRITRGEDLPAGRVEASDQVIWLLDEAAASGM
jgi:6-phosphogluconolactonase